MEKKILLNIWKDGITELSIKWPKKMRGPTRAAMVSAEKRTFRQVLGCTDINPNVIVQVLGHPYRYTEGANAAKGNVETINFWVKILEKAGESLRRHDLPKKRKCLFSECGAPFLSRHSGERICIRCKELDLYKAG